MDDTAFPNPGAGIEAIRLGTGNWALIYNDTARGRHSLAVSLSDDEGATWKWTRHLERREPGQGSFHYPSIIQGSGRRDPRDLHPQHRPARDRRSSTPGSTRPGSARAMRSHDGPAPGSDPDDREAMITKTPTSVAQPADSLPFAPRRGLSLARGRPALVLRVLQLRRPPGRELGLSACSRRSSGSRRPSSACWARRSWSSTPRRHRSPATWSIGCPGGCLIPVGPGVLEPDLRGDRAVADRSASSLFFRAAEGLGESFYFPASMSFLADYHGPRTRSRALGIHQTSVYLGTAGGAVLAGRLARAIRLAIAVLRPGAGGDGLRR